MLARAFPLRPYVPDVLVALALGALVVNTPALCLLGVGSARDLRDNSRFASGLKFVGRTLLRVAVVLMGFRIQAAWFAAGDVLVMFCAIAVAMPTTFLVVHAMALPLRVPRTLADLIAAGSMVCGASAINAVSPVVGAHKHEQGIALGTTFLFSVVALLVFHPIAASMGTPTLEAGLWSGLAVNDLSSAVAVGAQMGPGGAEMAAASKSARIVLLAPILVLFALLRAEEKVPASEVRRRAGEHLPTFVVGFVVLALGRAAGDRFFAGANFWQLAIRVDRFAVELAMLAVCAGIGFHLDLRGLLRAGPRAVALGAVACTTMATVTLSLVTTGKSSGPLGAALLGGIAILAAYLSWRLARTLAEPRSLSQKTKPILPTPR